MMALFRSHHVAVKHCPSLILPPSQLSLYFNYHSISMDARKEITISKASFPFLFPWELK